jgi:hypothetical protein
VIQIVQESRLPAGKGLHESVATQEKIAG